MEATELAKVGEERVVLFIDIFQPARIFERSDSIPEIDAGIAQVRGCLAIVPLAAFRRTALCPSTVDELR